MAEIVLRDELARSLPGPGGERGQRGDQATGTWASACPGRRSTNWRGVATTGPGHRARQIQPSWLAGYDLVVALDRANLAALRQMDSSAAQAEGRIRLLRLVRPRAGAAGCLSR